MAFYLKNTSGGVLNQIDSGFTDGWADNAIIDAHLTHTDEQIQKAPLLRQRIEADDVVVSEDAGGSSLLSKADSLLFVVSASEGQTLQLIQAILPQLQAIDEKDVANGYAPLDVNTKIPLANIPDSILAGLEFKGTWDADTNTPTLADGTGNTGDLYKVSVAGSTSLDGISSWAVGDMAVFGNSVWNKIDNTETVTSVHGRVGAVVGEVGDYTLDKILETSSASTFNTNLFIKNTVGNMQFVTTDFFKVACNQNNLVASGNKVHSYQKGRFTTNMPNGAELYHETTLFVNSDGAVYDANMVDDSLVRKEWIDTELALKPNFDDLVSVFVTARNNTGLYINQGSVVYVTGATGQNPTIALAQADDIDTTMNLGIASFDIPNNTSVSNNITTFGIIEGFNTTAFSEGDQLYLSPTNAGELTNIPPSSPNFVSSIGYCLLSHVAQGKILVKPDVTRDANVVISTSNAVSPTSNAVKQYVDGAVASIVPPSVQTQSPIVIDGVTTAPTKGTTVQDEVQWLEYGDKVHCKYRYGQSGNGANGSGFYLWKLPDGLSFNATHHTFVTSNINPQTYLNNIGRVIALNQQNNWKAEGVVVPYDATHFMILITQQNNSAASLLVGSSDWTLGSKPYFSIEFDFWKA